MAHTFLTASPENSFSSGVMWTPLWERSTRGKAPRFQYFPPDKHQASAGLWQWLISIRYVGHQIGCSIRHKATIWKSVGEVQLITLNNISSWPYPNRKHNCSHNADNNQHSPRIVQVTSASWIQEKLATKDRTNRRQDLRKQLKAMKRSKDYQWWQLEKEIPCINVTGRIWRKSIWPLENVSLLQGIAQQRQKSACM